MRSRQSAADAARPNGRVLRAGRGVAARRRFVARRAGERSSTPARRRAARRRRWRRRWGTTGTIVAADVRGRRVELLARTVAESAARSHPRRPGGRRAGRCRSGGDLRRRPGRRALLRPRDIRRDPDIRWRRTRSRLAGARRAGSARCSSRPRGSSARRTPDLLDLLQRARGERARSWTASCPPIRIRRRPARCVRREPTLCRPLDGGGFLRTLPFRDGLEAFFAARSGEDRRLCSKLLGYMALSTRVWGAGKRALSWAALCADLSPLRGRVDAARAQDA